MRGACQEEAGVPVGAGLRLFHRDRVAMGHCSCDDAWLTSQRLCFCDVNSVITLQPQTSKMPRTLMTAYGQEILMKLWKEADMWSGQSGPWRCQPSLP